MRRKCIRRWAVGLTVLVFVVCSLSVRSEDREEEIQELQVTLQALRRQNLNLQRQLHEALLKVEVLTMKGAKGGPAKTKDLGDDKNIPKTPEELRWQMLTTVRLLRRSELAGDELEARLRKIVLLSEDAVKSAEKIDPKKKALLEGEVKSVRKLLGPVKLASGAKDEDQGNLDPEAMRNAKVLDVRKDLSLVVLNVGKQHGIKLGMPFEVVRNRKLVAVVLVVEVRDKTCGALIERMEEDNPVKVNDLAVLRTT